MQSVLLISQDKKLADDHMNKLFAKEKIDAIDASINVFEKAVGIEDVRNIQKKIFLKPFKSKTKAVVIASYEGITIEAQNSLLKILEEPPANTIIIISAAKKDLLLPTIISRCKIIELAKDNLTLDNEENAEYLKILESLSEKGIGYQLKLAQDVTRNKEEVVLWLEKMAIFLRKKMIENHSDLQYLDFLKNLQKTYTIIKSTNVNQRIALENLFLSF